MQVDLLMHCRVMFVYICGEWIDVCVHSVMFADSEHSLTKCTGSFRISQETADNSKTKLCVSGSSLH